jgi:hypothetical protein
MIVIEVSEKASTSILRTGNQAAKAFLSGLKMEVAEFFKTLVTMSVSLRAKNSK